MSDYRILPLPEGLGRLALEKGAFDPQTIPSPWKELEEAKIDQYSWDPQGYTPAVFARIGYNAAGLHVLLYAQEPEIRAQETEVGGHICADSCLEFFFRPDPADPAYFNFEMNPLGVLHLGYGPGRHDRKHFLTVPQGMNISVSAISQQAYTGGYWAVSYTVPASLLQEYFPHFKLEKGAVIKGNLYKCGDKSAHPHWGTWLKVGTPRPDYHQPDFFGDMELL